MDNTVLTTSAALDLAPAQPLSGEPKAAVAPPERADGDGGAVIPGEHLVDMWVGASTQLFTGSLLMSRHAAQLATSISLTFLSGTLRFTATLRESAALRPPR